MLVVRWNRGAGTTRQESGGGAPANAPDAEGAPAWVDRLDSLRPGAHRVTRRLGRLEFAVYTSLGLNPAVYEEPGRGLLIALGTPSRGGALIPTEKDMRAWLHEVAAEAGRQPALTRLTDCEGFYAFLHYDAATQVLTVLTDRTGVAPLYTTEHDDAVWFSTSAAALARLRPTRIDPDGWTCLLIAGYPLRDVSLFEGIKRLDAGQLHACTPTGVSVARWWRPHWEQKLGGTTSELAEAYVRERRATLAARLGPMPRVHVSLTAGLDTRVIVALLRPILPQAEYFTGESGDEIDLAGARAVAETLGLRWRILREDYSDPAALRDTLLTAALKCDGEQQPFSTALLWARSLRGSDSVVVWGPAGEVLRDAWSVQERARWLLKGRDHLDRLVRYRMSGSHLPLSAVPPETRRTARDRVMAVIRQADREYQQLAPAERCEAHYLMERVRRWASGLLWKTSTYTVPELAAYGQTALDLVPRSPLWMRRKAALQRWVIEVADPPAARLPYNGGYPTRPPGRATATARLRGVWLDSKRLARKLVPRPHHAAPPPSKAPTYRTVFGDLLDPRNMHSAGLYDEAGLQAFLAAELDRPLHPDSGMNVVVGTEHVCRAVGIRP